MNEFDFEVKECWGNTEAYAEFSEKTKGYSKERFADINTGLEYIFRDFAELMQSGAEPSANEAQVLVKKLQEYITENYYSCTDEILAGLGQMYVADERFKANIDKYAIGTAEYVSKAIELFCLNRRNQSMFNLIKGAKFDFSDKLKEEYEIDGEWIYANVSAEKILSVFNAFIKSEAGCRFCLFIEIPSNIKDENPLGVNEDGWYNFQEKHVDVYYLDNISTEYINGLLESYGQILVNDGLSHFGILSQSGNEIGKYKYNVIKAHSPSGSIPKLTKLFEDSGLTETENLITAWNYFSAEHFGESKVIKVDGADIYDIVNMLCEVGMYKYEQRED